MAIKDWKKIGKNQWVNNTKKNRNNKISYYGKWI